MLVEIDKNSGFCFGVVRAISKAEAAVAELGGEVYSLGDIVHNRMEVQRLEALGLKTVTHEDMASLSGRDLFIRAHGEPPTTYRRAEELGIRVIDATCPVVAQLQRKVVAAHEKMQAVGGQVVILGKRGHAEVVGLTGQVEQPTIVVEREEDLQLVDFSRPVFFLSQTTQSIGLFWSLAEQMKVRLGDESMLTVDDTICRRVSNREKALGEFAKRFDVVIFVCGKKSSTKVTLADEARNGVKEEVRSGFLDWLYEFNVEGDDGELYAFGGSILSLALEKMDMVNLCYAKGKGCVKQLRNSIYKLAKYPGLCMNHFYRNPQGTLEIEKKEKNSFFS